MPGFKSFLSAVGHGFIDVFKYLGSPQGAHTIQVAEGIAVTVGSIVGGPGLGAAITGIEDLFNLGLKHVLQMEASAAAVGAQAGTGAQKSAAVVASLTPQVFDLLKVLGIDNPTTEQVESVALAVSNGLVGILNTIPAPQPAQ